MVMPDVGLDVTPTIPTIREETVTKQKAKIVMQTAAINLTRMDVSMPSVCGERTRTVMTNSGKCAYYAPGELGASVAFGTLKDCLRSATSGRVVREEGPWGAG